jgi:hypothetical protein
MELMQRLWVQFPEEMKNSLLSVLFLHGPILHHQLKARHQEQDVFERRSLQVPQVWHENMMKWLGYGVDGVSSGWGHEVMGHEVHGYEVDTVGSGWDMSM